MKRISLAPLFVAGIGAAVPATVQNAEITKSPALDPVSCESSASIENIKNLPARRTLAIAKLLQTPIFSEERKRRDIEKVQRATAAFVEMVISTIERQEREEKEGFEIDHEFSENRFIFDEDKNAIAQIKEHCVIFFDEDESILGVYPKMKISGELDYEGEKEMYAMLRSLIKNEKKNTSNFKKNI